MMSINPYVAHSDLDDLEKLVDSSSHHARSWVYDNRLLRTSGQPDHHNWDEQCCRSYQEELYCSCHICGLLRWQCEFRLSRLFRTNALTYGVPDHRSTANQDADNQAALPRAMAGPDHMVSEGESHSCQSFLADGDASYCMVIVLATVLYFILRQENSKRAAATDLNEDERDRLAFLDLTDGQNPYFRYVL